MLKFIQVLLLATVAVLILSGCGGAKIYNVPKQEILTGKLDVNETDIYYAIKNAATNLGWIIEETNENTLKGTLYLKDYIAIVRIKYTHEAYSITYIGSSKLEYDNTEYTIDKEYNNWILKLDNAIKNSISRL